MVKVETKRHVLKRISAEGHMDGRGCFALSLLLKSVAQLLHNSGRVFINGATPKRGYYEMEISNVHKDHTAWLQGVTDYLIDMLLELRVESPTVIGLEIEDCDNA